jgi:hypothetical protein
MKNKELKGLGFRNVYSTLTEKEKVIQKKFKNILMKKNIVIPEDSHSKKMVMLILDINRNAKPDTSQLISPKNANQNLSASKALVQANRRMSTRIL